jgi:GST-like protein
MAFCDDCLIGPTSKLKRALQEPVTERDSQAIETLQDDLLKYLAFLEKALEKSPYLAGPFFSLADIACMPILTRIEMVGSRLDQYPQVKAWIARLKSRPSYQAIFA